MNLVLVGIPESIASFLNDRISRVLPKHEAFVIGARDSNGFIFEERRTHARRVSMEILECLDTAETVDSTVVFCFHKDFAEPLRDALFPIVPLITTEAFRFSSVSLQRRKQSVNDIAKFVASSLKKLRAFFGVLGNEVASRRESALALPIVNFDEPVVEHHLRSLAFLDMSFVDERRPVSIRKTIYTCCFKAGEVKAFVNSKGVCFRSPGRALHGSALPIVGGNEAHNLRCKLASKMRFGVPITPGFHYDCSHLNKDEFKGNRLGCHGQETAVHQRRYLNIYPNDFVRVPKKK